MFKSFIAAALVAVMSAVMSVGADAAVNTKSNNDGIFSIFASKNKKKIVVKKKPGVKVVRRTGRTAANKPFTFASNQSTNKKVRLVRGNTCGGFLDCLFNEPGPGSRSARRINPNRQYAALSRPGVSIFRASGVSGGTRRSTVSWTSAKYPVGSLVVKTPERALYLVQGNGQALRYSVGVGKEGFQWSGNSRIVAKQEWPSWTPPQEMIEREAEKGHIIPDFMEGGPGNPLGARALYIGGTIFRVHGTNNERSIGGAVSSGCIRMMNADVIDLYNRVKVGARIYVYQ
jgi:lipoprotein-anchoring transpeptidase ErfK/SrfK